MSWKVKTDDNGTVVLKDGIPVWVNEEDGRESAVDVGELHGKLLTKGREAQGYQKELKALKERYAAVDGIDDLTQFVSDATKARETVAALEEKDLRKAETVEKIKNDMRTQLSEREQKLRTEYDEKLKERDATIEGQLKQISELMIDSQFDTCPLFSGPEPVTLLGADVAKSHFRRHFKLEKQEDGSQKVVARWPDGQPITKADAWDEPAPFDEAIQRIWEKYPDKDRYTRSKGGGSGATGGTKVSSGKAIPLSQLREMLTKAQNPADIAAIERTIWEQQQAARRQGGG